MDIDEVSALHMDVYNPALTRVAKTNFLNLIGEIKNEKMPNEDVADDILDSMHSCNVQCSLNTIHRLNVHDIIPIGLCQCREYAADEVKTLEILQKRKLVIDSSIEEHGGKYLGAQEIVLSLSLIAQ